MSDGLNGAKALRVECIDAKHARRLTVALHYSGRYVRNSQLHFGVFWKGICRGVMSFGPSLDKRKLRGLVRDTPWNGFVELNRLAFASELPRNSESRALAVAMRLLRTHAPHVQWVVSFADATQCGDGTIYRAAGFMLTGIRRNTTVWMGPAGDVVADVTVKAGRVDGKTGQRRGIVSRVTLTKGSHTAVGGGGASMKSYRDAGYRPLVGFQLRYLYFLDLSARERLTVPILPYSAIQVAGAAMYLGQRAGSIVADASAVHAEEGGSIPTPALLRSVSR